MFIALACSTSAVARRTSPVAKRTAGVDQQRVASLADSAACMAGNPRDRVLVRLDPAPFGGRLVGRIQRRRAGAARSGPSPCPPARAREARSFAGGGRAASPKPGLARVSAISTSPVADGVARSGDGNFWLGFCGPAACRRLSFGRAVAVLAAGRGVPDRGGLSSACLPGAAPSIRPATPRPA